MSFGLFAKIACGLVVAGAALFSPAGAQSGSGNAPDAAVFRALVGELARSPVEGVLLVDPRTINAGADLLGVETTDLGSSSTQREAALGEIGIATTDFLADKLCMFARGTPPAPGYDVLSDSAARVRRACRERPSFTSIVIAAPRPIDATDGVEVAVTVAGMTTSTYFVRDYFLRRSGTDWRVVRFEEVAGITS